MRQSRGLAVLTAAFTLRLILVPLSYWLPTLRVGERIQHALLFAPLPVTALTLIGFLLLSRGRSDDTRPSIFAQLTAALLSTEILFDVVLLVDPVRLSGLPGLVYLIEGLWTVILVTSWTTLRAVVVERGAVVPAAYSAIFYFALAMRAGLYLERAVHARPLVDSHRLDAAGVVMVIVALALPLLELLIAGIARRATPNETVRA